MALSNLAIVCRAAAHTIADTTARRAAAREALGVSRLPAGLPEALDAVAEKRAARVLASYAAPVAGWQDRLVARVKRAVRSALKGCDYRKSESTWAGGEHSTLIGIGGPRAEGSSERAWSRNGKWSGSNSTWQLGVSRSWLRTVAREGIAVVDGLLTLQATQVAPGVWTANWVVQGRGVALRVERGYLVREGSEIAHGPSEKACRRTLATRRGEKLSVELTGEALDVVVRVRDSLSAGNCQTGTDSWVARHLPCRVSATVREILAADPGNQRAIAACRVAVRRHLARASRAA